MELTSPQYSYGLSATVTPSSVYSSGNITVGIPNTTASYATGLVPDITYAIKLEIGNGSYLQVNFLTGEITNQNDGTYQVDTATVVAASGITGNGNATCVFTSALVTGSPLSVSVPVTTALTTATLVAGAIRTALQATSAITAHYTIGGSGASITATALVKAANDTTLNISISNGTCTGITSSPTSSNTTPGVDINKAYRIDGVDWDQTDFEGKPLPTATKIYSSLCKCDDEIAIYANDGADSVIFKMPGIYQSVSTNGDHHWIGSEIQFGSSSGHATLYIIIHAGT